MTSIAKRLLLGRPLATHEQGDQRLGKLVALPTFSADAISSTAYATEEILVVVAAGGSSLALGLSRLVPISLVVAVLLVIVVSSYRQTLYAYPNGGGSYIVSRENLGRLPSLVAAAALMIDYVLTVAVSISAGTAAIVSLPALHGLGPHRVAVCLVAIAVITLANLRGLKESGAVFAVPTYTYIVIMVLVLVVGFGRTWFGHIQPVAFDPKEFEGTRMMGGHLGLFLLLKGFSSGAVALSGVEAISNGVPAFKAPEPKNAATTMAWMAAVLGSLFFGVSVLAHRIRPYPSHSETILSQMGRQVFGRGPLYVLLQVATAGILTLAANTAYADFPRLASILAKDGFAPKQLARRGDRLVFSNGILILATLAGLLVVAFGGQTDALVPLYAVGVFTAFTLSQAGMVRHHRRLHEQGWHWRMAVNAVGAAATAVVTVVIGVTKFTSGAWIPVLVVPLVVSGFLVVRHFYDHLEQALAITPEHAKPEPVHLTVVVMVGQLHLGTMNALNHARAMCAEHLLALHVCVEDDDGRRLREQWDALGIEVPLEVVTAHYRNMGDAVQDHLSELFGRWPTTTVTLVTSQYAAGGILDDLLHNQSLVLLREQLMVSCEISVLAVPYRIRPR